VGGEEADLLKSLQGSLQIRLCIRGLVEKEKVWSGSWGGMREIGKRSRGPELCHLLYGSIDHSGFFGLKKKRRGGSYRGPK